MAKNMNNLPSEMINVICDNIICRDNINFRIINKNFKKTITKYCNKNYYRNMVKKNYNSAIFKINVDYSEKKIMININHDLKEIYINLFTNLTHLKNIPKKLTKFHIGDKCINPHILR